MPFRRVLWELRYIVRVPWGERKTMATTTINEITCRRCGRTISNELVDSAASGEGSGSDFYICECGERISFWQATGQLRDQKKLSSRLGAWFRGLSKGGE